jgi:hypothetical protein
MSEMLISLVMMLVMFFLASVAFKRELLRKEIADRPKQKKAA